MIVQTQDLSLELPRFKSYTARKLIDYLHQNPVKRGYVDDAVHWRYSSARNYAGLPGLIPVYTDWA